MSRDDDHYRALCARDSRFDGLFYVGVRTTGIYCRPVCRARTPRRERCRFFTTAAAAEREGFRACFRCRPELAPGKAPVDAVPRLVEAAVRRIHEGALNEQGVTALAEELGVTDRHLRRSMEAQLGVTPVELAQTERLGFARRLLEGSSLGLSELALAAGFGSVRRFNSLFRERFGRPPSAVRRQLATTASPGAVRVRLDYRPPLAWPELLRFLQARAIPGVEHVSDGGYHRTVRLGGQAGWLTVRHDERRPALVADLSLSLVTELMPLVARLRRLFDLEAQPSSVDEALGRDARLKRLVKATPGLRVPGAFDGFELAVRAVLGQQVTVRAATTLAGRLAARFGEPLVTPLPTLTHLFPPPQVLAAATARTIAAIGLPLQRARALRALAQAVVGGLRLEQGVPVDETTAALAGLPGFGDWTTQYVAMRALGWPDAFPAGDLAVRKALGTTTATASIRAAARWRPWRAYATLHLWTGAKP